ncbi:UNVERIFIED_CONTAM: hypothetical protein Sradi_4008500 [Sesamum radiatum]|uniref:Uncharacterized protein n=1 Tax=Sesamum radiatum TaxID=300843 RepID=A0AAW2PM61_SESRA
MECLVVPRRRSITWLFFGGRYHWGGTFPAWAGGCWAGSRTASGLGITKVGAACSGTTTSGCIVT